MSKVCPYFILFKYSQKLPKSNIIETKLSAFLFGEIKMKLDGVGLFVNDMATMVRFYRDVLGFEIKEGENAVNVYLIKNGTLFMLYERKNFEKMTNVKIKWL